MAFQGIAGLGVPLNLYELMKPDFRGEALQDTQIRMGNQAIAMNDMKMQQELAAAARNKQFQSDYQAAYGDPQKEAELRAKYPDKMDELRKSIVYRDEAERVEIGKSARDIRLAMAGGNPREVLNLLNKNKGYIEAQGGNINELMAEWENNPKQVEQMLGVYELAALSTEDRLKELGDRDSRAIQREGHRVQIRGQDLSFRSAMTGHGIAAERLTLDKQRFALDVEESRLKAEQLINAAPKLSVNMEKAIEKSTGDAAASRNAANSMLTLADTIEKNKPTPGLFGSTENLYAKLTGQDNYLRDIRIRYNQLANSQATKFLPPGPASDKDVQFARQGIPSDMDNPDVMARWLKGMAKLEENTANFNDFKSEWMSVNGNPGQNNADRTILGLEVKKGESLNSAIQRYLASQHSEGSSTAQPQPTGAYTSKAGVKFKVK